jgi:hypothetical protein
MNMKEAALIIAGIIFLTVSLLHLCRLIFKVEIRIGKFLAPLWLSASGFIATLLLAIWMFRVAR